MERDAILILSSFKTSNEWLELTKKLEEKKAAIEAELDEEMADLPWMSIHSLWRRMAKFVEELLATSEPIIGESEGGKIVLKQIELDILARKTNTYKAVQVDFEKTNSEHDVLRSQRNYIEGLLEYPQKIMDIEIKEQEVEEAQAQIEEVAELDELN